MTSRKEAVRIAAARLPVPEAAALVTEVYAGQGTHPDVRAACVAAPAGCSGTRRSGSCCTTPRAVRRSCGRRCCG
nr:hypothetical protein [Streptomyces sp. Alain-F2R5]